MKIQSILKKEKGSYIIDGVAIANTYNSGPFVLKGGPFIKKWDLLLQNSGPFLCEGGSSEPTEPPLATGLQTN